MAKLMNREFVDLDRTVKTEAKMAIADIFSERGEEAFRSLETAALGSVAGREQDLVVATGGGTATRVANVELMRSTGTSVWLDAPFEEILNRLDGIGRTQRPLFGSVAEARRLYEARRDAYAAADLRIDVAADASPEETAKRLQRILSAGEPANRFQTGRK
ncbi:MAG: shikimate kinase [bacterium]|nr:shikimate kinase [bacterium]